MSKNRERSFSGFLQSLGPPACSPDLEKEWAKRLGRREGDNSHSPRSSYSKVDCKIICPT